MKRKARAFLLVLAALMLVLSACSGTASNTGTTETGSQPPADTGSQAPAEPAAPKEPVEIEFWNPYTGDTAAKVEKLVEDYNAGQEEIQVKVLSNQDPQKQLTAISGGNPPDLVVTYWNNVGPWSEAGAVLKLQDLIDRDGFDTSLLIPAAEDRMKVDGELYGLPISMSMASKLFYNKQMFADAGIAAPPETLEEMFEVAKQLTKKDADGNITQLGFVPDYPWIDNVFWPIIFGGSWDDGSGKLTANQPANVASIEYQAAYYREFGNDQIAKFKSGMGGMMTPQDPIVTGKLGMIIGWENWYNDQRGADGVIGVAPFPYPKDNPDLKNSGMVSPVAMFIPAKSKNQDAAWKFMQYLVSEPVQIRYAIDHQTIPVLLSALDHPELKDNEKTATLKEFYEDAKSPNLNGFPNSIYINQYLQTLNEETEKALKGTISAQEAMDTVVKKMQPVADKAKK